VTPTEDVTREELARRLGDPALVLIDVRTAEEFSGELGAPCDPRQGHIPGARHVDVAELMGLTAEELRDRVGAPAGAEVIAYCHSGGRSAIACSLLRAAGYRARNYEGSWHEWSRDESLPTETS
jgi:thiosulfate/3-mercaptopyruvate sulfurtransferase